MVPPKTFNMYTCNTLYAFFACIIHPICKHQEFHLFNAFFPVYLGRICCSNHTGTYIMAFFQPKTVYWNVFLLPHIFNFDRAPSKVSYSDWNTWGWVSLWFYTPNCVPLRGRCSGDKSELSYRHGHTYTSITHLRAHRLTSSAQISHIPWGPIHCPVCSFRRGLLGTRLMCTQVWCFRALKTDGRRTLGIHNGKKYRPSCPL